MWCLSEMWSLWVVWSYQTLGSLALPCLVSPFLNPSAKGGHKEGVGYKSHRSLSMFVVGTGLDPQGSLFKYSIIRVEVQKAPDLLLSK